PPRGARSGTLGQVAPGRGGLKLQPQQAIGVEGPQVLGEDTVRTIELESRSDDREGTPFSSFPEPERPGGSREETVTPAVGSTPRVIRSFHRKRTRSSPPCAGGPRVPCRRRTPGRRGG